MIRKAVLPSCIAILITPFWSANYAQANHAEEVYLHCLRELEHLTIHCVHANRETAELCVRKIRELLHEGRIEQAIAVARHCIAVIEERTVHCLHRMARLCRHCVRRLHHLGAHELARRFEHNCEIAAIFVIESARRAIQAIEDEFDDRP